MLDTILVVCVGNVCRSPMGEVVLKNAFPAKKVGSAGIGASVGQRAADFAIQLMSQRGLDLSAHRARKIDERLMTESDLILVMERDHQEWVETRWPQSKGRVFLWGHWSNFEVPDPYGRDELAFREALALLDRGLDEWRHRL